MVKIEAKRDTPFGALVVLRLGCEGGCEEPNPKNKHFCLSNAFFGAPHCEPKVQEAEDYLGKIFSKRGEKVQFGLFNPSSPLGERSLWRGIGPKAGLIGKGVELSNDANPGRIVVIEEPPWRNFFKPQIQDLEEPKEALNVVYEQLRKLGVNL